MSSQGIIAIIAALGGGAGIISIINAIRGPQKKNDEDLKAFVTDSFKAQKEDIFKNLEDHFRELKDNDLTILRNSITHIYYKFKEQKRIPIYEKENWLKMYERYQKLGGNSYVAEITKIMLTWEEY